MLSAVLTTEWMRNKMSKLKLWAVILCIWYHDHEDGPTGECNLSNPLKHEHNDHRELIALSMRHLGCSWTAATKPTWCHSENVKDRLTWGSFYKELTLFWQWEEPSSGSNSQSDTTSEEHLKMLSGILSINLSKLLRYFTSVNMPCMCSNRPAPSHYTHTKVIKLFGDFVFYYNKHSSTHISQIPSYLTVIEGIWYDVHRYLTAGLLPL